MKTYNRILRAFCSKPWAVQLEKLDSIVAFLELKTSGGAADPALVAELRAASKSRREASQSQQSAAVAVIPLMGIVSHRISAMDDISGPGGTSTAQFASQFRAAIDDPNITSIVIDVDSPGGSVEGVPELAAEILAARGKKPITAIANTLMASAAYWIASAADEVVAAPSAMVGSIGVFAAHTDVSKAEAQEGVKITLISAGKYKTEGNPHEPLTDDARGAVQSVVDEFYGMFAGAVARQRGIKVADVRNGLGQGRCLPAQQALAAGLVDRVATLEQVLADYGVARSSAPHAEATPRIAAETIAPPPLVNPGTLVVTTVDGIKVDRMPVSGRYAVPPIAIRVAMPDDPAEDTDDPDDPDEMCGCACAQCKAGDHSKCSQPECVDPKCVDCPYQMGAGKSSAPAPPVVRAEPKDILSEEARLEIKAAAAAKAAKESPMETTPAAAPAVEVVRDNSEKQNVAAEIVALGTHFAIDSRTVQNALREGMSVTSFKGVCADLVQARLIKERARTSGVAEPVVDGLTARERSEYSIVRGILSLDPNSGVEGGLEQDVSRQIAKKLGKPSAGIYVPTRLNATSGLDSKTGAAGQYTVATEVRDLIELLRNKSRVIQLGATVLSGLDSNVAFPTQATAPAVTWVAENPGSDVADADSTFGQKTMTPKMASMSTSYSRKLLAQSTIDVESLVRNDIALGHALGIDLAALNGAGSSNQPLGLLGTTGIGSVADAGGNGSVPAYGDFVDLETSIAKANAEESGMKFLTTPGIRGLMRKTLDFPTASAGRPIWTGDGSVAGAGSVIGYDGWVTNQVPSTLTAGTAAGICHAIIFGYWPSLIIGEWGVIELIVDPYRLKKQGMIEVTSYQMVDVLLRYAAQFAAKVDSKLS